MKISLEDKLNLIRAKDYASKLNGVTSFDVSFLRKNDFMWHREMLMAINKTDNIIERRVFNLPLNINDLARDVESTLNVKKIFFAIYSIMEMFAYLFMSKIFQISY
ncbi:hypothetical protein ACQ7NR_23590 [Escherichia coli]|uniref:hypothetical protein n=1 Tax=Escherichia coli TaxID=562 RepID=UPI0022CBEA79|nr:hypothetical protein [Escherichia coli]